MPRHTAAATAVLAALALASCTSPGDRDAEADRARTPGPAVVAPGRPGEEAKTLSPAEAAKARPRNTPNSADISYVRNMIVHHRQALRMTELASKYAHAKPVRAIADRIDAAQRPEIEAMRAWLKRHGKPEADRDGHHHAAMPGMASEEELRALGQARGAAFDDLFLDLMIEHHRGALTMAGDVLAQGNDIAVEEMATDVIAQQSAEIARMRDM